MDYNYAQAKAGMKFSDLEEREQERIKKEWESLCSRANIETRGYIFIQRPSGIFFEAEQVSNPLGRYVGSLPGYWRIKLGTCKAWGFSKTPFGTYYPEAKNHYYSGLKKSSGEVVNVPKTVHLKKDVLALIKELEFNV